MPRKNASWQKGEAGAAGQDGNKRKGNRQKRRAEVREQIQNLYVVREIAQLLGEDWLARGLQTQVDGETTTTVFDAEIAKLHIEQNKAKLDGWMKLLRKTLPDLAAVKVDTVSTDDRQFVIAAQPMTTDVDKWLEQHAPNGANGSGNGTVINGNGSTTRN
ncbi:MAG: hypothetical protein AAFN78_00985 [Pseudomonadota bacterium]